MKTSGFIILSLAFCMTSFRMNAQTSPAPQAGKASVKSVVAAMTLEEKAGLVVGTG